MQLNDAEAYKNGKLKCKKCKKILLRKVKNILGVK